MGLGEAGWGLKGEDINHVGKAVVVGGGGSLQEGRQSFEEDQNLALEQ